MACLGTSGAAPGVSRSWGPIQRQRGKRQDEPSEPRPGQINRNGPCSRSQAWTSAACNYAVLRCGG